MIVAFLGDVGLFGRNNAQDGSYKEKFAPIREALRSADYVVANLETPLTYCNRHVRGKSACIKGKPEDVEILKYLGITHVSLANNHMYDFAAEGLKETIRVLDDNEISWYGVDDKMAFISEGNSKIGLLGYCCYSTNGKGLNSRKPFINKLDPRTIEKRIDELQMDRCLPVLSLHWGEEHVHYPNYDHVLLARKLCRGREIIVHGHHPHVVQGIENVGKSLVAYSLGNFCFDDVYTPKSNEPLVALSQDNRKSFILFIEIQENHIANYQVLPFVFSDTKYELTDAESIGITEYSEFLHRSPKEYVSIREAAWLAHLEARKKKRNLEWYLKRMNFNSVLLILSAHKNAKNYHKTIKTYIQ